MRASRASLVCELAPGFFTWTQFAELEPGAEAAHPAGTVRPSAACCHGISTKMLFLQHNTAGSHINLRISRLFLCFALFCSGVYVKEWSVGWETDSVTGRRVLLAQLCISEDGGGRLVTVRAGKWMREQNVIAAGHGWEQCVCSEGQVTVLNIGFLLRLWTRRIQDCYLV